MSFKDCGRTDGRRRRRTVSDHNTSPWAFGSGELKIINLLSAELAQRGFCLNYLPTGVVGGQLLFTDTYGCLNYLMLSTILWKKKKKKKKMLYVLTHFFFFFFFFFFDLGFTALSRIFHIYPADRSSKVGENRRTRRKTTWPSVSRTWLSHIWPERGSNHSGEKPNGLRVNSLIH